MTVSIFVLSLLAAMAIGMPIAYSLLVCGLSLMAYMAATGVIPAFDSQILAQRFVDGADNFPSRYLLNDASIKLGIPVVHGSIFRFEGMVTVFDPKNGPTYRDMVPEPPPAELAPSCAEAGVLGVLPGIVGSIQALETIKVLLGLGDSLSGRILAIDTTEMSFRTFRLRPDPNNQVTYANRDRIEVRDLEGACAPWLSH